jgi:hypothetical protein
MDQQKPKRDWTRRSVSQSAVSATVLAAMPRALLALPNAIAPQEALQRLKDGNGRYVRNQIDVKDFSAGR